MSGKEVNRRQRGNQVGEEMNPDMESLEAQLARLRPSEACIDRDRLFFLAGQAASGRETNRVSAIRIWQSAFAGMSIVASMLLAMVFMQLGELRARPGSDVATSDQTQDEGLRVEIANAGPSDSTKSFSDAYGTDEGTRLGSVVDGRMCRARAVYLEACDWMLVQGVDPWASPDRPPSTTVSEPSTGPPPYHQWRRALLENQETQI